MHTLITEEQRARMVANGERSSGDETHDPVPVVKLFVEGRAMWLLSEIDPEEPDVAFGLCDLGVGYPELGTVRLSAIAGLNGQEGMIVERDDNFAPVQTLSDYARDAYARGAIRA